MAAAILPLVGPDTTPEDLREALANLASEARKMQILDNLSRPNPQWARWHEAIDELLDALYPPSK